MSPGSARPGGGRALTTRLDKKNNIGIAAKGEEKEPAVAESHSRVGITVNGIGEQAIGAEPDRVKV
jgi:hypothetical protein